MIFINRDRLSTKRWSLLLPPSLSLSPQRQVYRKQYGRCPHDVYIFSTKMLSFFLPEHFSTKTWQTFCAQRILLEKAAWNTWYFSRQHFCPTAQNRGQRIRSTWLAWNLDHTTHRIHTGSILILQQFCPIAQIHGHGICMYVISLVSLNNDESTTYR